MAYVRKTVDEYDIEGYYNGEWEVECTESTFKDAKAQIKLYRENAPNAYRIRKRRIKKTDNKL